MAATMLNPRRVPQRVISYRIDDARSTWVGDDILCNANQIIVSPDCAIVEPFLPDSAIAAERFVDESCRLTFHVPDALTQCSVAAQIKQPVKMIWHDNESKGVDMTRIVFVFHRLHDGPSASHIREERPPIVSRG